MSTTFLQVQQIRVVRNGRPYDFAANLQKRAVKDRPYIHQRSGRTVVRARSLQISHI